MYHYASQDLTQKQLYKFLTGSVAPRPIAWITTYHAKSKVVNLAPFSYFTILASRQPLLLLSINRKNDGKIKDSARNLLETKTGIIHIVSEDLLAAMNETAATLPPEESELTKVNLATTSSSDPNLPALTDAKIRLHVTTSQHQLLLDSYQKPMTDVFYLKVTDFYFANDVFDPTHEYILSDILAPVTRLAGNEYGHLGKVTNLTRPQ